VLRLTSTVLVVLAVLLLAVSSGVNPQPSNSSAVTLGLSRVSTDALNNRAGILAEYGQLPLAFERNQGQSDPRVQFLSRGHGYTLFLTGNEAVLKLSKLRNTGSTPALAQPSNLVRMRLVAANPDAAATGSDELSGRSNYFLGNDRSKWHSNVPNYAKVKYPGVYPGIDLVYYGTQGELEYDFVVAPGADPQAIRLQLEGSQREPLRVDAAGVLIADTTAGEVRFHKPVIYQSTGAGQRTIVDGTYKLLAANLVGFDVSAYDETKALVIDPVLSYSSFLGSTNADGHDSVSVAVDSSGNAYIASGTLSTNFPAIGAFQPTYGGNPVICDQGPIFCGDAFVTKINATGTAIVYSTYLGGNDSDYAYGLAVDSAGNAYVAGLTKSTNFPVTAGVFQPTFGGSPSPCDDYLCGDAFITKLDSTGSALVYSSYLGGSGNEHPEGVVIDAQGNAYLAGDTGSTDFPTTPGAYQTQLKGTDTCTGRSGAPAFCHNAFLAKVNLTGTKLVYSTYLGGSNGGDAAGGIAVDSAGRASVVGSACSSDFPVTAGAFQPVIVGGCDIFVSTFNVAGSQLLYSTYFGGTAYEASYGAAVDPGGNVYISGFTCSTDFPVTAGAAQTVAGGGCDALLAKFNPRLSGAASLVYSTYLGGNQFDIGAYVAVDSQGNAYTCGDTSSSNFPVVSSVQAARRGTSDVFLTELNAQGSAILFSTYLGGSGDQEGDSIAIDHAGNVYMAGTTHSGDFPTTPHAFQPGFAGGATDLFVVKINPANAAGVGFTPASLSFANQAVGTTSPPQTVVLHDLGSAALVVSSITTAGDFAQTNNCAASVAGGGSCAVSITFTPTHRGSRIGSVSVNDNGGGSPQKIKLSGTGD